MNKSEKKFPTIIIWASDTDSLQTTANLIRKGEKRSVPLHPVIHKLISSIAHVPFFFLSPAVHRESNEHFEEVNWIIHIRQYARKFSRVPT